MKGNKRKQKGITLIALIITIIVMLILVGVTINVALNGGLFTQAQTATKETQKETEREQLLSAAVAAVGADGKVDSTKVVLPSGFEKDEEKTTNSKLVIKGKKSQIIWQINLNTIEIKEYEEDTASETYTFTIGELGDRGLLQEGPDGTHEIAETDFWREDASEELKNSPIIRTIEEEEYTTYNISCSESKYINLFDTGSLEIVSYSYALFDYEGIICFNVFLDCSVRDVCIDSTNYEEYRDLAFTISMAE